MKIEITKNTNKARIATLIRDHLKRGGSAALWKSDSTIDLRNRPFAYIAVGDTVILPSFHAVRRAGSWENLLKKAADGRFTMHPLEYAFSKGIIL